MIEISPLFPKTKRFSSPTDFLKAHLKRMVYFYGLPVSYGDLLYQLVLETLPEKQLIYANKVVKADIAKILKRSVSTVNAGIAKLVKYKVLNRIAQATFKLNPFILQNTDWRKITGFYLELDYVQGGRKLTLTVSTKTGDLPTKSEIIPFPKESLFR